ncbi:hypothetical protein KA025_01270 [Candidatus Saccharibacteria bacterium]|jgi:hypothetical protein|nr:hypothetical protein [Candidatus Saccharibacteria bacterium]MBP7834697.1 hypothetical protein [Candidatus Saccharibacteria bacterium]
MIRTVVPRANRDSSNTDLVPIGDGINVIYSSGDVFYAKNKEDTVGAFVQSTEKIATILRDDEICIAGLCRGLPNADLGSDAAIVCADFVQSYDYEVPSDLKDVYKVPMALTELAQVVTASQVELASIEGDNSEIATSATVVRILNVGDQEKYAVYAHIGTNNIFHVDKYGNSIKKTVPEGVGSSVFHYLSPTGSSDLGQTGMFQLKAGEGVVVSSGALYEGPVVNNFAEKVLTSAIEVPSASEAAKIIVDNGDSGKEEKGAVIMQHV